MVFTNLKDAINYARAVWLRDELKRRQADRRADLSLEFRRQQRRQISLLSAWSDVE